MHSPDVHCKHFEPDSTTLKLVYIRTAYGVWTAFGRWRRQPFTRAYVRPAGGHKKELSSRILDKPYMVRINGPNTINVNA